MSDSYPLPTEPEGVIPSLIERFNSGKVSAMTTLYEPGAVLITKDAQPAWHACVRRSLADEPAGTRTTSSQG